MPGIRPLLKLSFAANHALGLGLAGFHAVNLAIHAASALLALALLRRVAVPHRRGRRRSARAAPLLGALLFALHPVQVEAVTYVSGRSASLAGAARPRERGRLAGRAGERTRLALPGALAAPLRRGARDEGDGGRASRGAPAPRRGRRPPPLPLAGGARAPSRPTSAVLAAAAALFAASPIYGRMLARSAGLRPPWENVLTHVDAAGLARRPGGPASTGSSPTRRSRR